MLRSRHSADTSLTLYTLRPASQRYQMYMRDKEPSPTEHRFRCVRRLVSRTAEFPLVGSDWVDERVILCPGTAMMLSRLVSALSVSLTWQVRYCRCS